MKKIKYLVALLICFMLYSHSVSAISINLKSTSSSITIGQSITVTATISSSEPIASTEGTLMCTGAGSGSYNMQYDYGGNDLYSKSFTVTVKGSKAGTITCSTTGVRVFVLATNVDTWQNIANKTISIKVNEPAYIPPKTYSSNNNLKSLTIEGYDLSFSKDTLEYNLEVPNGTDKIKINAEVEDKTAKVSGTGERELSDGTNNLEITVTAENGNVKKYLLHVTVKELDPISVTIGKVKYTIIRKEGVMTPPENYEKSMIKIGDDDVLCYQNNKTGNILIGLKDESGNSSFFLYDKEKNQYSKYYGYKIGGVYLNILPMPPKELPENYREVSFTYDEDEITGYQFHAPNVTYAITEDVSTSDFFLIYAENENTGSKGLYVYDKKEGTIQRYNSSLATAYQTTADNYFLYLLISLVILATTIITFSIILMKKSKNRNKFA